MQTYHNQGGLNYRNNMTKEEYLKTPFKTDGEGKQVLVEDAWYDIPRKTRRLIERELKKGKIPDFVDMMFNAC